jgi:hypothetical protein
MTMLQILQSDLRNPDARFSFWLTVVRYCSIVSLLIILIPAYLSFSQEPRPLLSLSILTVPCLPYAWIFWRLATAPSLTAVKRSLASAIATGVFSLSICILFFATLSFEAAGSFPYLVAVVALLQITLVTSSIKSYTLFKCTSGDNLVLISRLAAPVFLWVIGAFIVPIMINSSLRASPEASSIGYLRILNTAQVFYRDSHQKTGFARSLSELGPAPGADLIDAVLASGKKSEYTFVISALPPDEQGRTTKYTIVARPMRYNRSGTRSFFTDESGIVRSTTANRAATVDDDPL